MHRNRTGKILVFFVVLLPALFGIVGLVIDGGMLMSSYRNAQQAADAAATAAALDLNLGNGSGAAVSTATNYVRQYNALADAQVVVNIPPASGAFRGNSNYVEVLVDCQSSTYFIQLLGVNSHQTVEARAVAGSEASTAGAAVVVLDPDPSPLSVPPVTALLTMPLQPNIGALECLGVGNVKVDGAVLVNNDWGGVDQNGNPAGRDSGPPYGASCTPVAALTKLSARDIRVVGGVDNPRNYAAFASGNPSPLQANKRPVPDPLIDLPVPTIAADGANVSTTSFGGVTVAGLPLVGPVQQLHPGVYDWIQVLSGRVLFNPGVYIIRGKNPVTQFALLIAAGTVTADGVMFYVTDSAAYDPAIGAPDSGDGETVPPPPGMTTLTPSTVINAALIGSSLTPLSNGGSPFDGMLIFQRRMDRRPVLIVNETMIAGGSIAGTIYAKWGQLVFTGQGTYDLRFAAGTVRFLTVLDVTLAPARLFPPVQEVFLVE